MQKVTILADSIARLPPDMVEQYHLRVLPINIHFGGKLYRDGVDITAAEAYRILEEAPDHFASSPASVGECLAAYREASTHAEGILCITISSKVSMLHEIGLISQGGGEAGPS